MPRILFVKTSSLGDVVHHCPAVSDAAARVPGAQIDWVVEEPFAEVAALHPAVRRVIPVAVRRWRAAPLASRTWAEFSAFRAAVREADYDAVIDTQGLLKSALLARLARGPRHGYDRSSAREPVAARFYDRVHAVPVGLHAVERNRRLAAAALGYAAEGAANYGLRIEGAAAVPVRPPYALFLTMTSREDKLWAEEHWRALGAGFARRGVQVVLPWGTDEERSRCTRVAAALAGALVPPRLPVAELARLARDAKCVVGVDTGLAHLAAASGAPVVGLFCGSDPELTGLHGAERLRNLGGAGRGPSVAEAEAALQAMGCA